MSSKVFRSCVERLVVEGFVYGGETFAGPFIEATTERGRQVVTTRGLTTGPDELPAPNHGSRRDPPSASPPTSTPDQGTPPEPLEVELSPLARSACVTYVHEVELDPSGALKVGDHLLLRDEGGELWDAWVVATEDARVGRRYRLRIRPTPPDASEA
jgi:hypothetical protein